jgi:hypothetical protein
MMHTQLGFMANLPTLIFQWRNQMSDELIKSLISTADEALNYADAHCRWFDISTAPEDGTVILVYRPDQGVFCAHYVEEDAHLSNYMNPPEGDCCWFSVTGDDLTNDMPTHWRPLPPPPSSPPLPEVFTQLGQALEKIKEGR